MIKHICKVFSISAVFVAQVLSLEFGTMGQVSASMGGAGVALKDSAWGLYYNPALLGADRRTKIAYSFGAQVKESNLLQLATIDVDNLNNFTETFNKELLGGSGASVTIGNVKVDGALGGALQTLFGGSTINDQSMQQLMTEVNGGTAVANCTSFATCATALKNDTNLANKLKDKFASAAAESGSALIGSVVAGMDASKVGDVLEKLNNGSGTDKIAEDILQSAGGLTITKGSDEKVDKLLNDFALINSALNGNDLNISSQNGLVMQFGGAKKRKRVESDEAGSIEIEEVDSGRGAIGVGIFASAFANGSAHLDPNNSKLLFDLNGKKYDISVSGNSITLTPSTATDLSGSVMNDKAQHRIYANALALVEVPVGYGHTIFTGIGDVNVGLAVKFIQAIGYGERLTFGIGNMPKVDFSKDKLDMVQTFGLDAGLLYTPSFARNFNIGIVAKNINAPTIKRTGEGIENTKLNTQVRAGLSYTPINFLTFAFDADIMPNNTLSLSSPKSQFIGGGVMANFSFIDFRLGAMQDIKSNAGEGIILTGGLNLFGFLDVALQYGLGKQITIYDYTLSNYMSVRIGGQFSF